MGASKDITGQKFNMLTALNRVGKNKNGQAIWSFKCECGAIKNMLATNATRKTQISCGCHKLKVLTKHGFIKHRLYSIWRGMVSRCYYEKHTGFKNYGRKGIKVCKEWLDFESFKNWALSNGYDEKLTLDRKNNFKSYSPDNCKWSDKYAQSYNRTCTVWCEINGKKLNTNEIFNQYGINKKVLYYRMSRGYKNQDLIKPIKRKIDES